MPKVSDTDAATRRYWEYPMAAMSELFIDLGDRAERLDQV